MNEYIRQWIAQGCDYAAGVAIYEQFGTNDAVKNILKCGDTQFFKKKLHDAMMQLLSENESEVNTRVENKLLDQPVPQKIEYKRYGVKDTEGLPHSVAELIKIKGQTYKDAALLHATLLVDKDIEKRKHAAFEILRLMKINQSCWDKLKYYDRNGALPLDKEPIALHTLNSGEREMLKQRNRVYLSRHQWIFEKDAIENPKYEYFAREYARRKKELEDLEQLV